MPFAPHELVLHILDDFARQKELRAAFEVGYVLSDAVASAAPRVSHRGRESVRVPMADVTFERHVLGMPLRRGRRVLVEHERLEIERRAVAVHEFEHIRARLFHRYFLQLVAKHPDGVLRRKYPRIWNELLFGERARK